MGFFTYISSIFNGRAKERYDYTTNSIISTLEYKNYGKLIIGGTNLNGAQKLIIFLIISGYFEITTQQFEMKDLINNDIDDIRNKAHKLTKLFFKDNLKWPYSHIDKVTKDLKELSYNNPSQIVNIINIGHNIAYNITTNKQLSIVNSRLFGADDASKEKGLEILDDAFNLMGF